ncbi:GNAT family N-acetyltransferase [Hyphococcus luteus]|uniref:N-acetyltransferase n=1 Tax=Hyphococcus luteus TaxID=2058213 RepID=A0A2S7K6T1_9PROT|nr:GNAT family N-acetyltransferase [Marinicaulis flavus]PQA88224.1 N-acetyltransferase [Marinicaulis flavus]
MEIREDDLTGEAVRDLLAYHFEMMHENSPPGMAYVLDVEGLKAPDMSFWSIWAGADLLGFGALKELEPGWGEIKSMRTHPDHLGKGAGAAMLDHIIGVAKARGYQRLSLETGSTPTFLPAIALYKKRGFENGEAFAGYAASDFNQFLHLDL